MPTRKLTAQTVHAPKPHATRVDYFDRTTPGFGLRITSAGVKTWFFMYRVNGTRPDAERSAGTRRSCWPVRARR
ncbi:MAG: hypothetical protein AUH43_04375 [Acidobacteria bacterium 13_1_40CM_65_14]|nr:MAG: hypothetical protein AUH43_04375 [Acidobacteria bacterium 13_1_40CM_65_14]